MNAPQIELERQCPIADLSLLSRAWVLPNPDRDTPEVAGMLRNSEIEQIAAPVCCIDDATDCSELPPRALAVDSLLERIVQEGEIDL